MYIFIAPLLLFGCVLLADYICVLKYYHKVKGIFQTLIITDMDTFGEELVSHMFVGFDPNIMTHMYHLGDACINTQYKDHNVRLRCYNVFATYVIDALNNHNNPIKKSIVRSGTLTFSEYITSIWWLHVYIFSYTEQQKYMNIANVSMPLFLRKLLQHC